MERKVPNNRSNCWGVSKNCLHINRQVLKQSISRRAYWVLLGLLAALGACKGGKESNAPTATHQRLFPEKGAMIELTDRPPQLETPLHIFKLDITPNEYFFVRWHLSQLVTRIDIDTFRLRIGGAVDHPLELSMSDLKTKFTPDSVVALAICSGNSRSTFTPRVPGSQWKNGAMGNAVWKGVKVKDLLAMAGVQKGAVEATFGGMDKAAMPGVADYVKSLSIDHAMDGEVMIAYEMNGQPIPMLNGYPLKLVAPGWYATYWVGALNAINVVKEKYTGFWMEKAYLVTTNPAINEHPDTLSKNMTPITRIKLHSIFVAPAADTVLQAGKACMVEGLAFDDGTGIEKVEISADGGATWVMAQLSKSLGKYSWQRWKYEWAPATAGTYTLQVRATDKNGNTQPVAQWNRSGYARQFIERLTLKVAAAK